VELTREVITSAHCTIRCCREAQRWSSIIPTYASPLDDPQAYTPSIDLVSENLITLGYLLSYLPYIIVIYYTAAVFCFAHALLLVCGFVNIFGPGRSSPCFISTTLCYCVACIPLLFSVVSRLYCTVFLLLLCPHFW
jgi:hypothetical protein